MGTASAVMVVAAAAVPTPTPTLRTQTSSWMIRQTTMMPTTARAADLTAEGLLRAGRLVEGLLAEGLVAEELRPELAAEPVADQMAEVVPVPVAALMMLEGIAAAGLLMELVLATRQLEIAFKEVSS